MNTFNKQGLRVLQPVAKTLRSVVLGASRYNEMEVLKMIEEDLNIDQVVTSAIADLFLVSLDLTTVFKIDANYLYTVQDKEDFAFIMIPESDKAAVSDLINFTTVYGVGSIVEVFNQLGKKRYTVEDIKSNLDYVVSYSGYNKHFLYEDKNYPLPIVNDLPFNSKVIAKGGYYVLELPTKAIKLSEHLEYYKEVYSKDLEPVSQDENGYYEYLDQDFKFITRLVLAHNFNCKRIAEVFNLPYEAFKGFLEDSYRYKPNHVYVYHYSDSRHDVVMLRSYSNGNFNYDPYKIINVA